MSWIYDDHKYVYKKYGEEITAYDLLSDTPEIACILGLVNNFRNNYMIAVLYRGEEIREATLIYRTRYIMPKHQEFYLHPKIFSGICNNCIEKDKIELQKTRIKEMRYFEEDRDVIKKLIKELKEAKL